MPDDDAQQPSLAVPVGISRNFSKQDNKLARRRLRRSRERAMSLLHTSCSLYCTPYVSVLKKIRIQFYFTSIVWSWSTPHSNAIWEEGGQGSELLCIMQSTILSYPPSNDDADAYPYDTFQQMNEND